MSADKLTDCYRWRQNEASRHGAVNTMTALNTTCNKGTSHV